MISLVWLIPAFPLAAFLINGLFGRRWLQAWTGVIASVAVGLSAVLSIGVFLEVLGGKQQTVVELYRWIGVGDFSINVGALIDPLSAVMLLVVTVVSFLIFVYANGYMADDRGLWRFFTWMSLFVFAMLILVMADNYLLMFVGWEGVGLCSYLLIGFWFERPEPYLAAKKAFVMNRIGDWGYTIGIITIFLVFGSMKFQDVFTRLETSSMAQGPLTLICIALFFGATGKSAQLPLYSWLPDAMEGPTPVSALIHAATMVTSGVYLVARSMPLFAAAGSSLEVVGIVGAATAIFAAAFVNGHFILYAIGIVTAVLTAFYVTRALWMTFYGEPRDHHLYEHAHESPTVMTLPLILLAVGTAVLGVAIGFPPEQGFIHRFLDPVVEAARAPERAPELATILLLAVVSVAAGVVGIGIGGLMYVRHRPDPTAVARAAGPLYRLLVNKYYIHELYDHCIVDLARAVPGASFAVVIHIIYALAY